MDTQTKSEKMKSALAANIPAELVPPPPPKAPDKDLHDDYDYSREQYKSLVDKSNQAIEAMLQLALQSEHPRAFEVLSTMLSNTADITTKLMELQQQKKDITGAAPAAAPQLTQNNVFLGSTTELQRRLISDLTKKNIVDAKVVDVLP